MDSKACVGCARAKRKCGKQKPNCVRCRTRGLSCRYPPSKPSSFVPLVDDAPVTFDRRLSFSLLVQSRSFHIIDYQLESCWFASPETWIIDEPPSQLVSNPDRYSSLDLDRTLKRVLRWLVEWVDHGSNPFIHQQLYRHRHPQCIQDAYLLLSSYLHKTAANEQLIFRIIEDRVKHLVAQGVPLPDLAPDNAVGSTTLDTLEHLARVQSLLVYQCIGLYDGNDRLRQLAEQHIPVLEDWLCQLISHAGPTTCCGESLISSPSERIANATSIPTENLLWYTWILAESTRRTWLVTAGAQGIYKLTRCRGTGTCMGGTVFTSRRGFWEASSAVAWEKQCSEVYAGLLRLTEVDKMFALVPRGEINEFAKLVLECTFGVEQMERWGI